MSETDSTQQLFHDWLQQCLSSSSESKVDVRTAATATTTDVNNEARTAFRLFTNANCNINEKLALLINELGPAFSVEKSSITINDNDSNQLLQQKSKPASMQSRLSALQCLTGALDGVVGIDENLIITINDRSTCISLNVIELVGNFLLQHCGPIQLDNQYDDDIEEQIRDQAIRGLNLLIKSVVRNKYQPDDNNISSEEKLIQITINFGRTGVINRCAVVNDDDDFEINKNEDEDEEDYLGNNNDTSFRAGLSILPRSRRSLVFDLLHSSIEAIGSVRQDTTVLGQKFVPDLIQFTIFCSDCLHGESDPRCLIQLLLLFRTIMVSLYPFFLATISDDGQYSKFPTSIIFDAISPYYPIQFNPPPNYNNIHGITKKKLRDAIIAIMSCTLYDTVPTVSTDNHSMLRLSIGIILEALVPPEEDEPVPIKERMETLEDLSSCLFFDGESKLMYLSSFDMKKLSDALITVHDVFSRRVSEGGITGLEFHNSKELATNCRLLVARIAREAEQLPNYPTLWDAFVQTPIRTMSSNLPSSPMNARVDVAYIANLCSCGGIKTLRLGLEVGLLPILHLTLRHDNHRRTIPIDDLCVAINAVGAFFASARATMDILNIDGIIVHPHPLQKYTSEAFEIIVGILSQIEQPLQVRITALKAFECIVTVAPVDQFSTQHLEQTKQLIRSISFNLLESNNANNPQQEKEWLLVSAECLGSFLYMALDKHGNEKLSTTIFKTDDVKDFLSKEVIIELLESIKRKTDQNDRIRYDREVLSKTCQESLEVANYVVAALMTSLLAFIKEWNVQQAFATAESLSFIMSQKHGFGATAFQGMMDTSSTSIFDILDALVPKSNDIPVVDDDVMYKLQLPPSSDDRALAQELLSRAETIIDSLRVAYSNTIDCNHLERLVKYVEVGLPPLSDYDFSRTYIALPLLSSALRNRTCHNNEHISLQTKQLLQSMTIDIADIAMTSPNRSAREQAAQCIYASIAYFSIKDEECYAAKVATETVILPLEYEIRKVKESGLQVQDSETDLKPIIESLSMLSLLGAAAAIRGTSSNRTVDEIIRFLLDVSCNKQASYPIASGTQSYIDLRVYDSSKIVNSTYLAAKAASSFGMLLVCAGEAPLRKQRLCHVALKQIKELKPGAGSPLLPLGIRISVCHIACYMSIRSTRAQDVANIAEIVLSSLGSDALDERDVLTGNSLKLTLTSVIKLLCLSPSSLHSKLYLVVTGAMRAFAYTNEIDCKLLALQILGIVVKLDSVSDTLRKLKAPVTSILGVSMNQSSVLLRQAAVQVRNDWFLVE